MKLDEKFTVLDYVIRQLSHSKSLENIIIATTHLEQDNVIVEYAKNNELDYFRGEPLDVLDRYYKCAKKFSLDTIVRMTSDAPFLDPTIVDKVFSKFQETGCDFASNNIIRTYPIGIDTEVFSMKTLEKTWNQAKLPSEREHVTPYIRKSGNFKIINVENDTNISELRLTVDRIEDVKLIKQILNNISTSPIYLENVLELFSRKPELIKINNHINHNEGFNKSLKEDQEFIKKREKNH